VNEFQIAYDSAVVHSHTDGSKSKVIAVLNWTLYPEGMSGSGGIVPCIYLSNSWRCVVHSYCGSFITGGKNINRKLRCPQNQSECFDGERTFFSTTV